MWVTSLLVCSCSIVAQAEVFMTDSHDDYFVRNLLLLLAETRALATVPDPAAIAECTVVADSLAKGRTHAYRNAASGP